MVAYIDTGTIMREIDIRSSFTYVKFEMPLKHEL